MTLRVTISTRTAMVLLVLAVLAIPATAAATHLFADVSDSNPHAQGIEFVKDSGVSVGCQDGTVYCPGDPVTRAQMATFMHRLSGTDPGTSPSVIAAGLDGLLVQSVTNGGDLYGNGNAVSATRVSTGHYEVVFDRSTVGCTGVASSGSATPGGGVNDFGTTFGVFMGTTWDPDPNTVTVQIWNPIAASQDNTSFHLMVMCP